MTPAPSEIRDPITYGIIGCAIAVHRELGPGMRESAYEKSLVVAFGQAGLNFKRQPAVDLTYAGTVVGKSYRPDFVVEGVVVEVKSVAYFQPIHRAQVLTYMKLARHQIGLLINFNVEYLIHGVQRLILTQDETHAEAKDQP